MAVEPPEALAIDRVTRRFGGLTAVNDVSFTVHTGEIFALIGPNGAGKTTLFNGITGMFPPSEGRIVFRDREITGRPPHRIADLGIARTFQNVRLFDYMTALDNVKVGSHVRMKARVWESLFHLPSERREEQEVEEKAWRLLRFVGVEQFAHSFARNLPYGQQRRLEIARALATEPKLLLLDEPAAGFTPYEKVQLMELMRKIQGSGVTVFLIEHDMRVVMGSAERIVVLDHGELIAEGSPEEVRNDPRVIQAYLGTTAGGGEQGSTASPKADA
ncbi:MAG: ABC transporter ATP-binding protein [Candidatus Dormibacteraeota bacterium]|nr:ABC transporter ATP-binding protein [Candidatus Dormibacteraeota bacterium]MBO0703806.1 ABC transporter ATP-binding protein [Candidatus Dormibacteraeota bacterium]MBO0760126.1 ABC transporter ATP-binding protein [Candidatus Dormibacteraeota bacterium]